VLDEEVLNAMNATPDGGEKIPNAVPDQAAR
jgi:hypothetical protein